MHNEIITLWSEIAAVPGVTITVWQEQTNVAQQMLCLNVAL